MNLYWTVRGMFFSKPKNDPDLIVHAEPEHLEATLGKAHFTNDWEFSYDQGEDINMRRPEYDPEKEGSFRWCQTHVRGYIRDDGTIALDVHYELEPSENPRAHLEATHTERQRAIETVRDILEEDYQVDDPE